MKIVYILFKYYVIFLLFVYGCSIAHCFGIVVSVTGWVCLDKLFDL